MTADEAYGDNGPLRAFLEERGIAYVLAVSRDHVITTPAGRRRAEALAVTLPKGAWQQVSCGDGAKGRLVKAAGARWAVEECFQAGKNEAGLDHYQVRLYRAWHRYVTLAMLALAWLAVTRASLADDTGTLVISANEIRRMFTALCGPPRDERAPRYVGPGVVTTCKRPVPCSRPASFRCVAQRSGSACRFPGRVGPLAASRLLLGRAGR
jgi:hypothetical protein